MARRLRAEHDWTFLFGPGVMPAINALCLGTVLYRSGLVPRVLPLLGLIGAPFLFGRSVAVMFGGMQEWSVASLLCTFPIAAWEFGLGCWLVAQGFRREPEIAA